MFFLHFHSCTAFVWWATAALKNSDLLTHCQTFIIWSSLVGECLPNQASPYSVDCILQVCHNSVSSENSEKKKLVSVSLILTCLDSSRWLSHTSPFLPFFSLSAHTTALTLPASQTCWQQFVSRYQFSVSSLRGREGCGNHLYLRLLGSVPLGMLADTCHWAAVRQKGCGMWAQATQVTVISFQKPLKLKP